MGDVMASAMLDGGEQRRFRRIGFDCVEKDNLAAPRFQRISERLGQPQPHHVLVGDEQARSSR